MFGLFNLNKPCGITSRRAVDIVARLVRPEKAGHAGTLDPLASGVLVICVGPATRLIEYVQRMPKRYRATFLLGRSSPTEDIEGEVCEMADAPVPSREAIVREAQSMVGPLMQRPPAYSAIKVAGRRSYALARAGQAVELQPRTVQIYSIEVIDYRYPQLELEICCGSGTYVRSLGRDLAERLGSCAVMSALVRTAIGGFYLADAVAVDQVTKENLAQHLLPATQAVIDLPAVTLDRAEVGRIVNGLPLDKHVAADADEYAAVDESGRLVAILTKREPGRLVPLRYFPQ